MKKCYVTHCSTPKHPWALGLGSTIQSIWWLSLCHSVLCNEGICEVQSIPEISVSSPCCPTFPREHVSIPWCSPTTGTAPMWPENECAALDEPGTNTPTLQRSANKKSREPLLGAQPITSTASHTRQGVKQQEAAWGDSRGRACALAPDEKKIGLMSII